MPKSTKPSGEAPEPQAPDTGEEPDRNADVAGLGYEQARDELATIVTTLENGSVSLEESMRLWERGEALAAHCHTWLDDAQQRVEKLTGDSAS